LLPLSLQLAGQRLNALGFDKRRLLAVGDGLAAPKGKVPVVMGCTASHDDNPLAAAVAGAKKEAATAIAATTSGRILAAS
jgi:hypothetical protein